MLLIILFSSTSSSLTVSRTNLYFYYWGICRKILALTTKLLEGVLSETSMSCFHMIPKLCFSGSRNDCLENRIRLTQRVCQALNINNKMRLLFCWAWWGGLSTIWSLSQVPILPDLLLTEEHPHSLGHCKSKYWCLQNKNNPKGVLLQH